MHKKWSTTIGTLLLIVVLPISAQARIWTSADGQKSFEGELNAFDPATGIVVVTTQTGKPIRFTIDRLSDADAEWIQQQKVPASPLPAKPAAATKSPKLSLQKMPDVLPAPDGKDADMTQPVQVFILLGQSNMVGLGKLPTLEEAVKTKNKYSYLIDKSGEWSTRKDVRNVFIMTFEMVCNDWMSITNRSTIGPEYGIGHYLGHAIDAPVMILKSCIGNRSLGWDLLPPGTEPWEFEGTPVPGYRGTPTNPKGNGEKTVEWYAGKQYDDDVDGAKSILNDLDTHYPGAKSYEIAGFFFWQGEKDCYSEAHAERYEYNLVNFIKALRKDFNAPNAKFVLATLGEATKRQEGALGKVTKAQLAVDGDKGNYPEFKGNVTTVFSNPFCHGGSGNSHYDGNCETYMDVGEAMGKAMINLLR